MMALRMFVILPQVTVYIWIVFPTPIATAYATQNGMTYRNYLHLSGVLEVKCSGKYLPPGVEVSFIKIFKLIDKKIVVIALPLKNTCETYQYYSSCDVKVRDTRLSTVKTLITELKGGETTDLGCSVNTFNRLGDTHTYTWTLAIMREQTTTTTSTTTTTTTANVAVTKYTGGQGVEKPLAASVHGIVPEYFVPPIVLIIGLCLIVFLAVLSLVLLVLQCRQSRRKRRNRAAKRESLLSTKSDNAGCGSNGKDLDLGVTTYRATRSFPSFPPGPPQVALSQGVLQSVLRYQKGPTDDTGYVSGSSNQYSEPYGCHEETGSTAERTRTAPRSVPMPQIKGSPHPPRLPENHP